MDLQRQTIRIGEKSHFLSRVLIHTDRFGYDTQRVQLGCRLLHRLHMESQMPQSVRLRVAGLRKCAAA